MECFVRSTSCCINSAINFTVYMDIFELSLSQLINPVHYVFNLALVIMLWLVYTASLLEQKLCTVCEPNVTLYKSV